MSVPRFHLPQARPGSAELPEAALNHATRVLRMQAGDVLRVFDAGVEFAATITVVDKRRVRVEVGEAVTSLPERAVSLHLIMSPLKGDLTEMVIQKTTELGVARISPVTFDRTDTVARRDPSQARRERWHRVAVSATEQSGRTVVPRVDPLASLSQALMNLGPRSEDQARIVAKEPSLAPGSASAEPSQASRSVIVAVGPAGGLSEGDLRALDEAGFTPKRLAVHTLRSETACIAAIAILGHRFR